MIVRICVVLLFIVSASRILHDMLINYFKLLACQVAKQLDFEKVDQFSMTSKNLFVILMLRNVNPAVWQSSQLIT